MKIGFQPTFGAIVENAPILMSSYVESMSSRDPTRPTGPTLSPLSRRPFNYCSANFNAAMSMPITAVRAKQVLHHSLGCRAIIKAEAGNAGSPVFDFVVESYDRDPGRDRDAVLSAIVKCQPRAEIVGQHP